MSFFSTESRPLEKMFYDFVCHELGIVPMYTYEENISEILSQMSDEESRKMRRKFRKLWRQAAARRHPAIRKMYMLDGKTYNAMGRRKTLVMSDLHTRANNLKKLCTKSNDGL